MCHNHHCYPQRHGSSMPERVKSNVRGLHWWETWVSWQQQKNNDVNLLRRMLWWETHSLTTVHYMNKWPQLFLLFDHVVATPSKDDEKSQGRRCWEWAVRRCLPPRSSTGQIYWTDNRRDGVFIVPSEIPSVCFPLFLNHFSFTHSFGKECHAGQTLLPCLLTLPPSYASLSRLYLLWQFSPFSLELPQATIFTLQHPAILFISKWTAWWMVILLYTEVLFFMASTISSQAETTAQKWEVFRPVLLACCGWVWRAPPPLSCSLLPVTVQEQHRVRTQLWDETEIRIEEPPWSLMGHWVT